MLIEWAENPLETKVTLNEMDRQRMVLAIQEDQYSEMLCSLEMKIKDGIVTSLDKVLQEIRPWEEICNLEADSTEIRDMEQDLLSSHAGDCVCIPCSCMKCRAEGALGINTIEGLGKHSANLISSLFREHKSIDDVIPELSKEKEYKPSDSWPLSVEAYNSHIPRWKKERAHALEWIIEYKNKHKFGTTFSEETKDPDKEGTN